MPFTYDMKLPSDEELTVDEINLSMAALYAGAHHLGKFCEAPNNEFILCRKELDDPRKCLNEGKDVTKCALNFFQLIKKECREEFENFASCLRGNTAKFNYSRCRDSQKVFDKCVLDKLGMERPPTGWASEIHVHKAKRERPEDDRPVFTGVPDKYEPAKDPKPPKHGSRLSSISA